MKRLLAGVAATGAALFAFAPAASAQTGATVTLLHGIPGVTVDVFVDGNEVVPDFAPGATQDLSSFAGQTLTNVEVRVDGSGDVAIGPLAELAVPGSGNWTVVAHLDAEGTPTLTPFENDVSAVPEGQGRLTVRHTAAAPAVDVVLGDQRPFTNVANGQGGSANLPAGEIAGAKIAPTGGDPIADVPTVTLGAGTNLIVYAVGSLADETFTFYTQEITGLEQTPAPAPAPVAPVDEELPETGVGTWVLASIAIAALGGGLLITRSARRQTA